MLFMVYAYTGFGDAENIRLRWLRVGQKSTAILERNINNLKNLHHVSIIKAETACLHQYADILGSVVNPGRKRMYNKKYQ